MDHEIYVTDPHIFYKVDLWVTLIHYPKYNISLSNSLQDMKRNRLTIKYSIYLIRSVCVTHWSIIPIMMFIHQIILKILTDLHILDKVNLCVTLIHYPKYNISPSNSLQDMKQNRWTIKYSIYLIRSVCVTHWSIIPIMMFIHQIILKILSKISRPWRYRSLRPPFILRSNVRSYWPIIPNYDVHISKSLQDVMQNHWTMKYRSQWPTFILRSNIGSYWFILPKYDVHQVV